MLQAVPSTYVPSTYTSTSRKVFTVRCVPIIAKPTRHAPCQPGIAGEEPYPTVRTVGYTLPGPDTVCRPPSSVCNTCRSGTVRASLVAAFGGLHQRQQAGLAVLYVSATICLTFRAEPACIPRASDLPAVETAAQRSLNQNQLFNAGGQHSKTIHSSCTQNETSAAAHTGAAFDTAKSW